MRKIKQNSIIFVILYGLIFYSINFILSINNIVFMNWIYYFSNGIIILGSIIGIYQLILKIKAIIEYAFMSDTQKALAIEKIISGFNEAGITVKYH